jgi:hypothetical protein
LDKKRRRGHRNIILTKNYEKQDKSHQRSLEELSMDLSKSQGVGFGRIYETAKETEQLYIDNLRMSQLPESW